MNSKGEILRVDSFKAGYADNVILQDVSFGLNAGEVLVIIGQNGSGKSTLLKSLCGVIPRKGGNFFFNGKELDNVSPYKLSKLGISYMVQEGLIMPALTIYEHFELASPNGSSKKQHKAFQEAFDIFPKLYELRDKKAGNLSGGERQMLSFGILLIQGTSIWFLDEPTAGLSPSIVEFTTSFLQKKNKEEEITMLVVEHNMGVAFKLASHIAVTKNGTLTKKFPELDFKTGDFLNRIVYN